MLAVIHSHQDDGDDDCRDYTGGNGGALCEYQLNG